MDAIKVKKESYRSILAHGTTEAVDSTRPSTDQAGHSQLEVWEELSEAMEDSRFALKNCGKLFGAPGAQCL